MKIKNLVYLLLFLAISAVGQNEDLFVKGNSAYNEGNYAVAIENYEKILENGEASAELYFNLANAHYKLGNVAPSVYYYEKALQLDPNDPEIKNNLTFAQNMVLDDIREVETTGITRIWRDIISIMGYNQWAWLAVTFSALFAISFLIYYFSNRSWFKRLFFTISVVLIIFSILAVLFAYEQYNYYTGNQYAIIFAEEAEARSEPTLRSEEIFTLHEGTKIEVLETYEDWVRFELANGVQGWMNRSYVRNLN